MITKISTLKLSDDISKKPTKSHFLKDQKILKLSTSKTPPSLFTVFILLPCFCITIQKIERDKILDASIETLNSTATDFHVVLLHNPDGLEFLLQRLLETHKTILHPTLFLSGHTHGGMFDIPLLRHIGLRECSTIHGRYKGWYGPEGKYAQTGDWRLYVSTGMGNSK